KVVNMEFPPERTPLHDDVAPVKSRLARQQDSATLGATASQTGVAPPALMLCRVTVDWSSLKGVLIDLDGVVYTGRIPIPGAAGFLSEARRRGLKFLLVTNNSTTSPELVAERLRGMQIDVGPDEILTSAQAAVGYVKLHAQPGARVRVVGEAGLK